MNYTFDIAAPDEAIREQVQQKIDNLNKPKGSLGRLEELAMQVCLIQQTLSPTTEGRWHLLFGGDHGIEREGVSVSPREVTWQQMINFTRGGGGVNMFCRQHGFQLRIVDVGVDYDLSAVDGIENYKIDRGTRNFRYEAAMTDAQFWQAIGIGASLVSDCHRRGCSVLSIGEMGIGNTSPSSIWMHLLGGVPLSECIGAGAGLDSAGQQHKLRVLSEAVERYTASSLPTPVSRLLSPPSSLLSPVSSLLTPSSSLPTPVSSLLPPPSPLLPHFGGFEMVAAVGAMLRAAELHLIILIDGFIMTACAMAAAHLYPAVRHYMVFTHCGDESGHQRMLQLLDAQPLLRLGLRLGEGTGALCAFPLVDSAVRMINEMNNFDNAHITRYF